MESADPAVAFESRRKPRKLVLCFDGTGNKFHGDDSDTNILKIYRMLDRNASDQYHYYQPGIGTYVVSGGLGHHGIRRRISSWYAKAKDSAIGSSFDQHVVGGYRFLMRFYTAGDEIYIFGFSRGAYIARFLAEMLDYVGLLSHGNEEMVSFAWKAFSQWQCRRTDNTEEGYKKKHEMYAFLKGFRETFSRPVRRIRFLGLFDTVNSVPRFETAWMERSKFPYTARSSAKVIRHAVSIDERRAKFRQDLMYQSAKADAARKARRQGHHHGHHKDKDSANGNGKSLGDELYRPNRPPRQQGRGRDPNRNLTVPQAGDRDEEEVRYRLRSRSTGATRSRSRVASPHNDGASETTSHAPMDQYADESDDETEQDIDEVWFAGGHGDVGGGWEIPPNGKSASHVPLAWMVREAMRAGLSFDMDKVVAMGCCAECVDYLEEEFRGSLEDHDEKEDASRPIPGITVRSPSGSSPTMLNQAFFEHHDKSNANGHTIQSATTRDPAPSEPNKEHHPFHHLMQKAHTALIHDSLSFSSKLGFTAVLAWKIMEYLPFRRMDLQGDGSWKPIRWPLPCGEVRDVPQDVRVHGSVLRRMQADEKYRPGNLIVGGGGRGMRRAPKERGMGSWVCVKDEGDPVGEVWMKREVVEGMKEER